jgi:hypothetical protein
MLLTFMATLNLGMIHRGLEGQTRDQRQGDFMDNYNETPPSELPIQAGYSRLISDIFFHLQ